MVEISRGRSTFSWGEGGVVTRMEIFFAPRPLGKLGNDFLCVNFEMTKITLFSMSFFKCLLGDFVSNVLPCFWINKCY